MQKLFECQTRYHISELLQTVPCLLHADVPIVNRLWRKRGLKVRHITTKEEKIKYLEVQSSGANALIGHFENVHDFQLED